MRLSIDSRNAAIDAVTSRLAGGLLRIFAGDDPETAQLLVELRWQSPAFATASNGVAVSYPLASAVATASGNPTFGQALSADGSLVFDESVNDTNGSGIHLEPAWIEAGGAVVADSIAYSQ